ncbi:MAG: aminoacyl-tRNA hydrolase, partial [Pigeon pea little leaf phytoplasma]|nr:aminoacyl-tRNA hydrolase [Pigeon pea little leaf phytoplasma]
LNNWNIISFYLINLNPKNFNGVLFQMYKLIVGLGNPGVNFHFTPHNVGFMLIDYLLKEFQQSISTEIKNDKFNLIYQFCIDNQNFLLIKPKTYMNLSGLAVKNIIDKYQIELSNVLIVHDEINLNIGQFKIKQNGNYGGHNGIKNLIDVLKTRDFMKLKIGVGYDSNLVLSQYVLQKMHPEHINLITSNFCFFKRLIEVFINTNSVESLFKIISDFKKNN